MRENVKYTRTHREGRGSRMQAADQCMAMLSRGEGRSGSQSDAKQTSEIVE
jgi:hypothetical protein